MQLISVIIPVYNGEQYLAEAIQSVLAQTHPPQEIIVVDDGSTDFSWQIAAAFSEVRLVRKAHSGLAATLNEGVRQAVGELLAFLDHDDRWLPDKLRLQVAVLEQDPTVAMVFGHSQRFEVVEGETSPREVLLDILPGVAKSSMLVRRSAFAQVGEFAETAGAHDFIDWYARACEAGLRAVILPQVLYERRIHAGNMGVLGRAEQRRSYVVALREKLKRRREATAQLHNVTPETP